MSLFKSIKTTVNVLQSLDLAKLGKLSQKVDLNKMVGLVSSMKDEDLQKLIKFMEGGKKSMSSRKSIRTSTTCIRF